MRKIELLAPAKNLECGIEAINHGADAVYIGAPLFSARSAAGNTLEDIKSLTEYAHQYGVKIYAALNTILSDSELKQTEKLIWDLYTIAKVDALIVQDMGITMLNLPPIALHASTQMDIRDVDKAVFLEKAGFRQIVLARELTIDEIRTISEPITVPLEAFVHGALCVCYSGQCYLSQALSGRSANKGACAQYCRLPYTLVDSAGEEIVSKKHLLSMKDLNQSENLEEMIDAGVSSLKIEGRLKDVTYVKNTVAYYRKKLDEILSRRPTEYVRASSGVSRYTFEPKLEKSFNRGFTQYFLHNRSEDMWSINSPKSLGEPIGRVEEITPKYMRVKTSEKLSNGDGLCFFNKAEEMEGMRINRVEGDKIYLSTMPDLKRGYALYRNFDQEFENQLSKKTAERKIQIKITLSDIQTGFGLSARDADGNEVSLVFDTDKELAQKDQSDNLKRNLTKTGNTIFEVTDVIITCADNWFIPASVISEWRRVLIDKLLETRIENYKRDEVEHVQTLHPFPVKGLTYLGNVMNEKSKQFYLQHETSVIQPAFEKMAQKSVPLMFTRHCIKQSLGYCPKERNANHPYQEPFLLTYNKTRLRLNFDCKKCEMQVYQDLG